MVQIIITSGKHSVEFALPSKALTANRLATEITNRFEVPEGAEVPPVTYEDDEGDTINLHLGVAVEFEEALRVMQRSDAPLRFALVKALAPREAEAEVAVAEAAPAAPAAVVAPNTANVVDQIQTILQAHAAGIDRQMEGLQTELATTKDALSRQQEATLAAEEKASALDLAANELKTTVTAKDNYIAQAQGHLADLRERVSTLEGDVLAERQARSELEAEHVRTADAARLAAAAHADEKKGLVDTIAEQREQLTTKQLEVDDLNAVVASEQAKVAELNKLVATLQGKLQGVYANIAGLLPDTAASPSPKTKIANAFATVGAVCTAGVAEVTEAVQGTHNYARGAAAAAAAEGDESAAAAPKQGGGGAAVAAAAAALPSPFVLAMDAGVNGAMDDLEEELAVPSAEHREAFRTLRDMGFGFTQGHVSQLMNKHNNDVAAVLSEILA